MVPGPWPRLCRESGLPDPLAIVDWGYNAWGGKYPPFDLDDIVPSRIAEVRNLPYFIPE